MTCVPTSVYDCSVIQTSYLKTATALFMNIIHKCFQKLPSLTVGEVDKHVMFANRFMKMLINLMWSWLRVYKVEALPAQNGEQTCRERRSDGLL